MVTIRGMMSPWSGQVRVPAPFSNVLPDHNDKLFVVDSDGLLKGVFAGQEIALVSSPDELVAGCFMSTEPVILLR